MTMPWAELLIAGGASAVIGLLSGIFGFGGGFLLVPVLSILLGFPIEIAAGSSACQVLGPATTSLLARRVGWSEFRFPLTISGGLITGVAAGAAVLHQARNIGSAELFGRAVNVAEVGVLATYAVLLLSMGLFSLWEANRSRRGRPIAHGWMREWSLPPQVQLDEFGERRISVTVLAWFGLAIGFLAGVLGNSGGLFLLPGLVYLLGVRTQDAIRSSLVIVWLTSCFSTISHAYWQHVDLSLVIALMLGGTIGARIGSEFGKRLPGLELRKWFGWLVLLTGLLILARLLGLWFSE